MKLLLGTTSLIFFVAACFSVSESVARELEETIKAVKPAVVAIGSYQKTRSPAVTFVGTGFAVNDGLTIITNAHVVASITKVDASDHNEIIGILSGKGENTEFRPAVIVAIDEEHDLARLKISPPALPVMKLGDINTVAEGQPVAFTGFPLGTALGFYHATHRGIISSITPITRPASNSQKLDAKVVTQLRHSSYSIFQLDATAFPGNSGSPVYHPETGEVIGIINMVFVKGLKETAISTPSGITYAIPVNFVYDLLQKKNP
jgi:serine protease Do